VTIHMLGPRRSNSIEMTPLAMLLSSIGIVNGEYGRALGQQGLLTGPGAFSVRRFHC
jgi:hypothetical protein